MKRRHKRLAVVWTVLVCLLGNQLALAAPSNEAATAAANANLTFESYIATPSATEVVPNYTTSPPETQYYGNPDRSVAANAKMSACAGSTDPSCQAARNAVNSALAPKPRLSPYDPNLTAVQDIQNDPGAVLGDLSQYYPDCTTTTAATSAGNQKKLCKRFVGEGELKCAKKLVGETIQRPTCAAGQWFSVGFVYRNGADTMQAQALCEPDRKDAIRFRFYASGGRGACNDWQTIDLPRSGMAAFQNLAGLEPHWEGSCWGNFFVGVNPSPGCKDGNCQFNFVFGNPIVDPGTGATVGLSGWGMPSSFRAPANEWVVTDVWDNECTSLEENQGFGACQKITGPVCVDGPSKKTVQGHEVSAPCWRYESSYTCSGGLPDECAPLAAAGCTKQGSSCLEEVPGKPGTCGLYQDSYQCAKGVGTASVVSNCTQNCVQKAQLVSPAQYKQDSCYNYFERLQNQVCDKTLDVAVDWICPAGAQGPTRDTAPAGSGNWTCLRPKGQPYCPAPLVGPSESLAGPLAGQQVCSNPTNGAETAAPLLTADQVMAATPVERDLWTNPCADMETRVPLGLLPPDGQAGSGLAQTGQSRVDRCSRTSSVCTAGPASRLVNDHQVSRSCWAYKNTFDCISPTQASDCSYAGNSACTELSSPICIDRDTTVNPTVCTAWRTDFQCKTRDAVYKQVTDCGEEQPPADADFVRTVAFLEAGREAGKFLDPNTMKVFSGLANTCDKSLFGLTNCCKGGGSGESQSLLNDASMLSTVSTAYEAVFSTYTYAALVCNASTPMWVIDLFGAASASAGGTGFASPIAGLLSGNLSFTGFLSALSVFAWIAIIIAIIQYSGILDCPDESLRTAMKKDARLCVLVGEYCSKKVLGSCYTRTQSYCCYLSKLARIINEEGRKQLGKDFGDAKSPKCDGFTIAELQKLNFAAMDFSEFFADIKPKMPDVGSVGASNASKASTCYYGKGKC